MTEKAISPLRQRLIRICRSAGSVPRLSTTISATSKALRISREPWAGREVRCPLMIR